MNQILDLAGSYVIGGIVLLAIVGLTIHFTATSQNTKLTQITQLTMNEVGGIIEHDFDKLGYRVDAADKIIGIDTNSISFLSDIDNNGLIDTVTYKTVFDTSGNEYLKRAIGNQQSSSEWTMPVNDLIVKGYNSAGALTTQASQVKSVSMEITLSQKAIKSNTPEPEPIISTAWKRVFYPKNL